MQNLPTPILGEITAFTITSPDLVKSLAFYQKLGYKEIYRADYPFPWVQVSDGVVLIMLRQDPQPYIALTYYVKVIDGVVKKLEKAGIKFAQKPKPKDMVKRYLFTSPDNINISLVNIIDGFYQPKGPGMLSMKPEDYAKPEKYVNKTCGLYGEFAHPVKDLEQSLEFWKSLGFIAVSRFTAPYPWAIISDGLSIVGLHQSAHFSSPTITYFAADMSDKISKLKKNGLTDFKENGPGIVLTTPEKQHIFLYQLGLVAHSKPGELPKLSQVTIETPRLILKELNPEVVSTIFNSYPNEQAMEQLGLKTIEEFNIEKNNFHQGLTTYRLSFKKFLIISKETNKVIGKCGFNTWYLQHARAEIGYAMADNTVKNKGFMTEAVKAMIKYGFEEMKLNRIEAFIGTQNVPSLKMIKGLGFTEEGTLRSHYFKNGKMEDSVCFSLLKQEY